MRGWIKSIGKGVSFECITVLCYKIAWEKCIADWPLDWRCDLRVVWRDRERDQDRKDRPGQKNGPSLPSFLLRWVVWHLIHLWLTGKMESSNQSRKVSSGMSRNRFYPVQRRAQSTRNRYSHKGFHFLRAVDGYDISGKRNLNKKTALESHLQPLEIVIKVRYWSYWNRYWNLISKTSAVFVFYCFQRCWSQSQLN